MSMGNILLYALPVFSLTTAGFVFWITKILSKKSGPVKKQPSGGILSFLFRYGRRVVYAFVLLWALFLYARVSYSFPAMAFSLTTLMRYYALTALFLLYIVLTPGILLSLYPRFFLNGLFVHLRRAVGVSVFFFVSLHASIGFFNNLSGSISSIIFLSGRNQLAVILSSVAFCIFALMAITSFDVAVNMLGKKWKRLHRFIYIAAILSVFHAFLIGSHFTNPTGVIPLIVNYLSLTYILLEVIATVRRRLRLFPGISTKVNVRLWMFLACVVVSGFALSFVGLTSKYDPHAAHRKRYSKNYTLSVTTEPKKIIAGEQVSLTFTVTDKRTNRPLKRYQKFMDKLMHVVVLRRDLLSYDHIHPDYDDNGSFHITHVFPVDGTYYLFDEYSPPDFYENLSVATVTVGSTAQEKSAHLEQGAFSKIFANTNISLQPATPVKVNETVDFTYTLSDTKTGQPITDLEPYLAAFGHMSAVSEDLQTYTHVHPINAPLSAQDRGGPVVQFSTFFPKAGRYKVFTQFKRNGEVFVTDFVIAVQ